MVIVCNTLSCHDNYVCAKLFLNPTINNKVMDRTRTDFTEVYAQSLSADCDLDLSPSDMVLFATDRLVMMIICVKIFLNPIVYG